MISRVTSHALRLPAWVRDIMGIAMGGKEATEREPDAPPSPPAGAASGGLVTARDAAALLGVNERTMRRAIGRGDLPATKRGRGFQITPEALARFREQRARGGSQQPGPPQPLPANLATLAAFRPLTEPRRHPRSALPAPLTRFIGREHEVLTLAQRLRRRDVRLVTLTGPGGVGKTRLALRTAEVVSSDFADDVVFVSLAEVRRPSFVLPAIARAVGIREAPGRSLIAALHAALEERPLLLVLDNLEHLLDQAMETELADLLHACRGLVVLGTSRAPLGLSGEHRFGISPLGLPGDDAPLDFTRLATYEAIALFVERARQVQPDFALDAGNAAAVLEICRCLDGLPLAIELAAASPEVAPAVRARALRGAGVLAWQSGDFDHSRERLECALAAYDALGDRIGAAWVLSGLGCLFATRSVPERAEPLLSEALAIFRELGDAVGIAQLTANLGELAGGQGQHGLAIERLQRDWRCGAILATASGQRERKSSWGSRCWRETRRRGRKRRSWTP